MISNLINNAVESIETKGRVHLKVFSTSKKIEVVITDNGKGIPPEILKKLGERGLSFGKTHGNGLGLHHAKTTIGSWGGQLNINSEVGIGTNIIISIPRVAPPSWLISSVKISSGTTIVVMDDDPSVKEVWAQRLSPVLKADENVTAIFFSTPDQVIEWQRTSEAGRKILFLLDFEILGMEKTGLDLVDDLKLRKDVILVTSRWEDPSIQERCVARGICLLPKSLAGSIPVEISPTDLLLK